YPHRGLVTLAAAHRLADESAIPRHRHRHGRSSDVHDSQCIRCAWRLSRPGAHGRCRAVVALVATRSAVVSQTAGGHVGAALGFARRLANERLDVVDTTALFFWRGA